MKDITITGYRDMGGITGIVNAAKAGTSGLKAVKVCIKNCSDEIIKIVQDLTNGYKSDKPIT